MRSEILISQTEATMVSARASMRCHAAYVPAGTWFDATTGLKPTAAFNHNPAPGPGGTS